MKGRHDMKSFIAMLAIGAAAASWATGAAAQPIPVMKAEDSRVANPPPAIEPGVKGYGVRAVEGRTLDEMRQRCGAAPASRSALEQARCDQLRRTLKTQPGGRLD